MSSLVDGLNMHIIDFDWINSEIVLKRGGVTPIAFARRILELMKVDIPSDADNEHVFGLFTQHFASCSNQGDACHLLQYAITKKIKIHLLRAVLGALSMPAGSPYVYDALLMLAASEMQDRMQAINIILQFLNSLSHYDTDKVYAPMRGLVAVIVQIKKNEKIVMECRKETSQLKKSLELTKHQNEEYRRNQVDLLNQLLELTSKNAALDVNARSLLRDQLLQAERFAIIEDERDHLRQQFTEAQEKIQSLTQQLSAPRGLRRVAQSAKNTIKRSLATLMRRQSNTSRAPTTSVQASSQISSYHQSIDYAALRSIGATYKTISDQLVKHRNKLAVQLCFMRSKPVSMLRRRQMKVRQDKIAGIDEIVHQLQNNGAKGAKDIIASVEKKHPLLYVGCFYSRTQKICQRIIKVERTELRRAIRGGTSLQ